MNMSLRKQPVVTHQPRVLWCCSYTMRAFDASLLDAAGTARRLMFLGSSSSPLLRIRAHNSL